MNAEVIINIAYIASAILFVFGLKMLGSPASARKGNMISALGMLLAVGATLATKGLTFQWIAGGIIIGSILGILAARLIAMTAMPEMVALLNGSGGIASLFVGWAVYHFHPDSDTFTSITIFLSVLIGGVTFTGSVIAWGKLSEKLTSKPVLYAGQKIVNSLILVAILACGIIYSMNPAANYTVFIITIILSLVLGVLVIIPIGGADMPVVIALLNSYSGLAACAAGFVIQNNILIVAGSLVGASGLVLTKIMCKAMNRSLANVLFSGFGSVVQKTTGEGIQGEVKPITAEDAFFVLEAASSVIFVPGYGMAVAQAQHVVRELGELLEVNGTC